MTSDRLSTTFAALADPTRRAILARLISGEASVTQLAEPFRMSMPAVSRHLKVLERAGLIARSTEAQWRPCQLNAAPLKDVSDWAEHYRQFFEQSFDRLEIYLDELKMRKKQRSKKSKQQGLTQMTKQRKGRRYAEENENVRKKCSS
jgi:DNA-binding transcriptional ArsR family regulator